MKDRVEALLRLEKSKKLDNIIFGSGASKNGSGETEAKIAKKYYASNSLASKSNIYLDEKSNNTKEELENLIKFAIDNKLKEIIIISSSWHIQRCMTIAMEILRKNNIQNEIQIIGYPSNDDLHQLPTILETPHINNKIGFNLSIFIIPMLNMMINNPKKFILFINDLKKVFLNYGINLEGDILLWSDKNKK